MSGKKLFIVAGEASGDAHAANLIHAAKELIPDLRVEGLGGDIMRQAGCELRADLVSSAVMGFVQVAKKIRYFQKLLAETKEYLQQQRPDLLVLVDYPGFNLRLAETAKKIGIPIVYYISPQVWAWRPKRIKKIARLVDKMIVILPFEKELYANVDVDVSYVGHPLLDSISKATLDEGFLAQFDIPDPSCLIGLLPGSRRQEIESFLPVMLDTARLLLKRMPRATFLIPCSSQSNMDFVQTIIGNMDLPVKVFRGKIYEVANVSRCCIVASGTATLEVAFFLTPLVVVYKTSHLLWLIGRKFLLVDHISLVNILAGKEVVPEMLQYRMKAELLDEIVFELCQEGERRNTMINELKDVRSLLGTPGAAARAAKIVCDFIEENGRLPLVTAESQQRLAAPDG